MSEQLPVMPLKNDAFKTKITEAVAAGHLLRSTAQNISTLLRDAPSAYYEESIAELVAKEEWTELNDRFFKTLAFGTGGIRGRTMGKIVTRAERGEAGERERPQFPCVGTNAMNFFNVARATKGLVSYLLEFSSTEGGKSKRPKIVIACDSRYFSDEFTALTAQTAVENGCDACVFEGPRSTPELSFAVRYLRASAGIVITASHNPPHDNGYKAYFNDGAQVIEPHASGIIAKVNSVQSLKAPRGGKEKPGKIIKLGPEIDEAYMERLGTLILQNDLIRSAKSLRVVFTPLYGTGRVIIIPVLERLGFNFQVVEEQNRFDGSFPTVDSPNPENASALRMGVDLAEQENADLVIATDPDCDRMGVAVRTAKGKMDLLTGNQIGSLLAYYRAKTLFQLGVLTEENASRGVIIKTFVTSDLQKAIAEHYGLRCIETLTGFKYIGAKLGKYENALPKTAQKKYRDLPEDETRRLRLKHSSYFVFGGEESYGFSGGDFVRDKDGNAAAIMFCEVAAYAKSRGLTIGALLDEVYSEFGYFHEFTGSLVFEGAEGAETIKRLLGSYVTRPPTELLGARMIQVKNFETDTYRDLEGDEIPKEKMLVFEFGDHTRITIRASGTEPKIKYYLFAQRCPKDGKFSTAELEAIKDEVGQHLKRVWEWVRQDAANRTTPLPARQSSAERQNFPHVA